MADETLVERLKRLQASLLAIYAETVELRTQAEAQAKQRQLSGQPEFRRVIRPQHALAAEPDQPS